MTLAASIKFVQGVTIGTPGVALLGATGTNVTASNGLDSPDVVRSKWTMIGVPGGSSVPTGLMSDGPQKTVIFLPDVRGTYHVELVVFDASGSQKKSRLCFGILETTGRLIPAFDAEAPALNFGGQLRGWAKYMEEYLRAVDSGGGGGGSPGGATDEIQVNDGAGGFAGSVSTGSKPATGRWRIPYDGTPGNTKLVVFKNSGAVDKDIWTWGFDAHTFGNFGIDLSLHGSGTTALDLASGLAVLTGATIIFTASGKIRIQAVETVNEGTAQGRVSTFEAEVKATAAPTTFGTFTTPTGSMTVIDVEIVAIKSDGSIGMRGKISQGFLNVADVITSDTPDAPAPSFIGGAPGWTFGFDTSAAPDVKVSVDPMADTVTFYIIRSAMRIVPAP
jgi:hypothetical protein